MKYPVHYIQDCGYTMKRIMDKTGIPELDGCVNQGYITISAYNNVSALVIFC